MRLTLINNDYIDGEVVKQGEMAIHFLSSTGDTYIIPWSSVLYIRDNVL